MIFTEKLKVYMGKLALRVAIVIVVLFLYFFHRDWMREFLTAEILHSFNILHIFWGLFMLIMLMHLFPSKFRSMGLLKMQEAHYVPVENYSEFDLLKYVQKQNQAAWMVLLVWLFLNGFWALLYLIGIITEAELLLLSTLYFLCDYICILFFCPFQSKIMHNKCCVNCRIYDWGHFMMFTPMLFIKNFFSWSLFFMSLVVLIRWEIVYASHPERFWEGSNKTLQCVNCKDKTCQMKEKLAGRPRKAVL